MLELTLIRHGETDYNAERRMQGQLDIPLSDNGLQQAQQLAKRLKDREYDYVYSSDLARAYVTAKTCFPKGKIITDSRLRERSYGDFEGKVFSEYNETELKIYQAYKQDTFTNGLPGGESGFQLYTRVHKWLKELPTNGKAIVFTHGGVVRSLVRSVEGRHFDVGAIENTSINRFVLDQERLQVIGLNDNKHIVGE